MVALPPPPGVSPGFEGKEPPRSRAPAIRARGEDPAEVLALLRQADYRTFAWDETPLHDDAILARPLVRFLAVAGEGHCSLRYDLLGDA